MIIENQSNLRPDKQPLTATYQSAAKETKNGKIVAYAIDMQMGVVRSNDNQRYVFCLLDWRAPGIMPASGIDVTFELIEAAVGNIVDDMHPPLLKNIKPRNSVENLSGYTGGLPQI